MRSGSYRPTSGLPFVPGSTSSKLRSGTGNWRAMSPAEKNASSADDWLRTLYRDGFLAATEFEERLSHLQRLREGLLKPPMPLP